MSSNRGFNGSSLTWNGVNTYPVTGLDLSLNGQKVDITDITQSKMIYTCGLPDIEITVDLKGGVSSAFSIGTTGTITITWNDGSSVSLATTYIVQAIKTSGKINAPIESTVTWVAAS